MCCGSRPGSSRRHGLWVDAARQVHDECKGIPAQLVLTSSVSMIELTDVTKVYGHGEQRTVVLDRINFRVEAGEILAVVGPSGAGKSTLAQCINLLTLPTSGSVVVNGDDLTTLSAGKLRV